MEHKEENDREYRYTPYPVRQHSVRFVGLGELDSLAVSAYERLCEVLGDVFVPFVRDDCFEVVTEDVVLYLRLVFLDQLIRIGMRLDFEFVAFDEFDCVEERVLDPVAVKQRLDLAYRARKFGAAEHAHRFASALACAVRLVHQLLDALAFERGNLHDGDAELVFQRLRVDLVARLFHRVHHIERDHHRNFYLHQLSGEIKVAFQVRRVDDVDDEVGLFVQYVIARDDLFGSVRRKRINAGQVEDFDGLGALFVDALLFVNGDAGPVADVRRRPRQRVEQRCLAAVGVARECEFNHSATSVSTAAASVLRRVSS